MTAPNPCPPFRGKPRGFVPWEAPVMGAACVSASWDVQIASGDGEFRTRNDLVRFLREFNTWGREFTGCIVAYAVDRRGEFTVRLTAPDHRGTQKLVIVEERAAKAA